MFHIKLIIDDTIKDGNAEIRINSKDCEKYKFKIELEPIKK